MRRSGRRATWALVLIAFVILPAHPYFLAAAQTVLGADVGEDLTEFLRLQKETPVMAALMVWALDWGYRLRRGPDGWSWTPSARRRVVIYSATLGFAALTAFESVLRTLLQLALPSAAASLADWLHRTLESSVAAIVVLLFLDYVVGMRTANPMPETEKSILS